MHKPTGRLIPSFRRDVIYSDPHYPMFARACAEAGPPYCAIATANSSQADIAAWLWNFVDFAHDHPLGTTTSALARGESLYYYILSAYIG